MVAVKHVPRFSLLAGLMLLFFLIWPAAAQQAQEQQAQEKRIALVIGNAAYRDAGLPTTANDAGLIAEQLQAAGFDVSGARDLDGDMIRRAFRDFLEKARQAGPDSVAMVYFAGYGLQFEGENYLVLVDAQIPTAADVPIQAVRVSDLTPALAELPMKARIVVLDAARENPFAKDGPPLAGGLVLVEPDPGFLVAFNAAPGTVAPPEKADDNYGAYARALAEMIREGGVPLRDVFDQARLRVSDATKGAVVPWDADRVEANFMFFERSPEAPTRPPNASLSTLRDGPLGEMGVDEAYQAALEGDTISAYEEFLAAYPDSPEAKRVRAILAARREELTWRRTLEVGTAEAYWSYLRRYPRGPHTADCQAWLARLAAPIEPPPDFAPIEYDVPPPPPDEPAIVDQPALTFADFDLPPPPPVTVLPPPSEYIVDLPPPPPPVEEFVLPTPEYAPLPVWVDRPVYVAPPPVNIISYNIHNTVIVNRDTVVVRDPTGNVAVGALPREAVFPPANGAPGMAPQRGEVGQPTPLSALAALHVALPPSVGARAEQRSRSPRGAPAGVPRPGAPTSAGPAANVLPGLAAQALPGQPNAQPLTARPAPWGQRQPAPGLLPQASPGLPERPGETSALPRVGPGAGQPEQQRAQQAEQQRAQQLEQQRQRQLQMLQQQRQLEMQRQIAAPHQALQACGRPGMPPCR